jgi:hypothetical protein
MKTWLILILFSPLLLWGEKYTYQLAVGLMFQNEARHLKEWIEYHKLIGVEHFYLCNNLSDDNFFEVIEPYIASGEVEYFDFPAPSRNQPENLCVQNTVYNHFLLMARGKVKWLAFIDADEYIVPLETDSLIKALKPFENQVYGGVYMHWKNFGTSHVEKIPEDRLRIETLLHCDESLNLLGKSIVRPERVSACTDPHLFRCVSPYFNVNTDFRWLPYAHPNKVTGKRILVHHYYTGDIDYLIHIKFPRRKIWYPHEVKTIESYIESLEPLNSKFNDEMNRFIPQLRTKLFKENL